EVLAIEEVARVEAAELPEQVAAHCHERAVHPVHPVRRAPEPRAEAAGGRVEHQVTHGPEAPGRRLPAARIVDQPAAGDARTRHPAERIDQGLHRAGPHARVGVVAATHYAALRRGAAVAAAGEAE